MSKVEVTCDTRADAAYIYLTGSIGPGEACRTVPITSDIILDFDKDGCLIGIELLSGKLLHPTLAAIAKAPGQIGE